MAGGFIKESLDELGQLRAAMWNARDIGISTHVTIDQQLMAFFKNITDKRNLDRAVSKALRAGSNIVLARAKQNAPVGPDKPGHKGGAMKRYLATRVGKRRRSSGSIAFHIVIPKAKVAQFVSHYMGTSSRDKSGTVKRRRFFYPAGVEYGTKRMPPHPFMRPAFDATKGQALAAIAGSFEQSVRAAATGK